MLSPTSALNFSSRSDKFVVYCVHELCRPVNENSGIWHHAVNSRRKTTKWLKMFLISDIRSLHSYVDSTRDMQRHPRWETLVWYIARSLPIRILFRHLFGENFPLNCRNSLWISKVRVIAFWLLTHVHRSGFSTIPLRKYKISLYSKKLSTSGVFAPGPRPNHIPHYLPAISSPNLGCLEMSRRN